MGPDRERNRKGALEEKKIRIAMPFEICRKSLGWGTISKEGMKPHTRADWEIFLQSINFAVSHNGTCLMVG